MENREQQILAEIKDMMSSIRGQLEILDAKMQELQQVVDPESFDIDPIELDIETEIPAPTEDDLPFDDVPDIDPQPVQQSDASEAEQQTESPVEIYEEPSEAEQLTEITDGEGDADGDGDADAVAVGADDDLPGIFDVQEVSYPAAQIAPKVKPSVAEVMAQKQAWRNDMPGTPVKDVRSAISLNDRIIFINHLFNEDPIIFQEVIVKINSMDTLDQVVEYLGAEFSDWDMSSELVYRFMMAVRRRVK